MQAITSIFRMAGLSGRGAELTQDAGCGSPFPRRAVVFRYLRLDDDPRVKFVRDYEVGGLVEVGAWARAFGLSVADACPVKDVLDGRFQLVPYQLAYGVPVTCERSARGATTRRGASRPARPMAAVLRTLSRPCRVSPLSSQVQLAHPRRVVRLQ